MQETRNLQNIPVEIDDSYFVNHFGVAAPKSKTIDSFRKYKATLETAIMQQEVNCLYDLQKAQKVLEISEPSVGISQILTALQEFRADVNLRFDRVDEQFRKLEIKFDERFREQEVKFDAMFDEQFRRLDAMFDERSKT